MKEVHLIDQESFSITNAPNNMSGDSHGQNWRGNTVQLLTSSSCDGAEDLTIHPSWSLRLQRDAEVLARSN